MRLPIGHGSALGVILLLGAGCGASVTSTALDGGSPDVPIDRGVVDVGTDAGTDVGRPLPPAECAAASDCAAMGTAPEISWCSGTSRWSCLAGRCTWECRGGRTCVSDAAGCVSCTDNAGPAACPGARCEAEVPPMTGRPRESTCMRPFASEVVGCFGAFARLRDGSLCSVQDLFTGAPRSALLCGRCQTVLEGP